MEQLTVKEFSKKIRDKHDLYEAVHRNGFHLPSLKSGMVTEAYLLNVMEGTYFCPMLEQVRLRACPRPPQKDILVKKFLAIMRDKGYAHGLSQDKLPDKQWLISVISSITPEDEIFRKDYLPPPRKNIAEEQKTMNIPKDFLAGLPDSRSKAKRRKLKVIGEGMVNQRIATMRQSVK